MIEERLTAQLLAGPSADGPVAVAERLLAIQAQDLRGAQLAIRPRAAAASIRDVDRALTEDRSLVVTWLNRGTLHLVRREDLPLLQALTTPQLATANARRLAQEGVSPADAERGADLVERTLADGPATREELREPLERAGIPAAGPAFVHILMHTALRGTVVRGPMAGAQQAFVLTVDWLGPQPGVPDRPAALAELARRYLAGHGPATDRDLARWAGIGLGEARAGLRALAGELQERGDGLLALAARPPAAPLPAPRLLGPFDPLVLGWADRDPILGAHTTRLVTSNGIFRPLVLVRGRAVGTWKATGDHVAVEVFDGEHVTRADRVALVAEEADVARYLLR